MLFIDGATVFAALGIGIAVWLVLGALTDLALKSGLGNVSMNVAFRRFIGLPRSVFGTALAHLGLGVTMLGIVSVVSFETEQILTMAPRPDRARSLASTFRFDGIHPAQGPNFTEDRGRFVLLGADGKDRAEVVSSEALLSCTPHADHGSWHQNDGLQPALCRAR